MSPVQKREQKLTQVRNLRPPRERMFPVNRPAERRMSRVQERPEGSGEPGIGNCPRDGNGCFRSTGRRCDARRGAAEERDEGTC